MPERAYRVTLIPLPGGAPALVRLRQMSARGWLLPGELDRTAGQQNLIFASCHSDRVPGARSVNGKRPLQPGAVWATAHHRGRRASQQVDLGGEDHLVGF